ncbi:hypothetical protein GCM10010974_28840 [Brevibacterium sediminis]|uniref:RNA polymerase sigma factor 70 region 4 type 2 domain-containing protein n=1 Tax=Brevibacterium sediminis TaxID=1857024 RepID=A0ABQ1MQ24_9MICO|nr:sigma factor-like helix-turn-helix DNA-binding protein [Brevibacterium sediminis]GGC44708.1 hypothetical protein GCM10010974_28840 [Brevibacterium sediminis]
MNEHQPDENLADFTNDEILKLIGSGTVGAFSEIYRRHIDDSMNGKAGPRAVHDAALLAVLKQVLDSPPETSEELETLIERAVDEQAAHHDMTEETRIVSEAWARHSNVAHVFSSLPDNWQRILWLREVEGLEAASVAQRLNVTAHTAARLASRARQELQRRWRQEQGGRALNATDLCSALIPALLTSPTLIERFADTLNNRSHTAPTSSASLAATETNSESASAAEWESALPPTESGGEAALARSTEAAQVAQDIEPSIEAEEETALVPSLEAEGETASAASTEAAQSVEDSDPSTGAMQAVVEDSEVEKDDSAFHLPKPVLIPVAAACVGLLGSLVGLSISPISSETSGYRTDVGSSSASTGKELGSRAGRTGERSASSGNSSSDGRGSSSSSVNDPHDSEASEVVGRDGTEPPASHGDDRTAGKSSSGKKPGGPGNPDPTKPDSPTPSEPDEPDAPLPSKPDVPSDPPPSEPDQPSDPAPSEPDEPDTPSPSEPDEPGDPAPSESDEPDSPNPSESDQSSDATSTSAPSETEGAEGVN